MKVIEVSKRRLEEKALGVDLMCDSLSVTASLRIISSRCLKNSVLVLSLSVCRDSSIFSKRGAPPIRILYPSVKSNAGSLKNTFRAS